jgi:signal transduction histidine kinase
LINRQAPAGSEGDRVRAHAAKITQYCERMNRLIADLLDYATIHTGRFTIVRKAERTLEVIDEAIDICQHQAQGRSIRFEKQVPSDCERLHCDRGRLVQVFANLLGNAVKFSPNEALVRIAAQTSDAAIQFSIEDHGAGIAPEHLALVFEPYWKGAHKEGGGTGLGLFIVRGIIEAHQGRIWVESSLGRGTTFFFTVPREPSG